VHGRGARLAASARHASGTRGSSPRGQRSCALVAAALLAYSSTESLAACAPAWPLWTRFVTRFVQNDGRVINLDTREQNSVSEAQAYTLVLALVANDPGTFGRVLTWTRDNLWAGDLTARLPAWQWGRKRDGSWGILDQNSAADADLWLAYALLEAGRLWKDSSYTALGKLIAMQIAQREVVDLAGVGPMLIPGVEGFRLDGGGWRLNASYAPLPVLRRLALDDPSGPWDRIASNTVAMIRAVSKSGFVPDWNTWSEAAGFGFDAEKGDAGSFDAIRVYLWAGMTHPADPQRQSLLGALSGMAQTIGAQSAPPRSVRATSGVTDGIGPLGFSAAVLPYLSALNLPKLLSQQELRVAALSGKAAGQTQPGLPGYYDSILLAFGKGWTEHRFRFDKQGRLIPQWRQPCEPRRN
jgi:endoglucanase